MPRGKHAPQHAGRQRHAEQAALGEIRLRPARDRVDERYATGPRPWLRPSAC